MKSDKKNPTIFCSHGHGAFGKDPVAGVRSQNEHIRDIQDLLKGYEGVKRIYQAAGVADKLWADIHSGPHAFAGNKAFEFFKKYL